MQFNFPDHTKMALDPYGRWCHFWHLSKASADRLAETGTLGDAALDMRSALTYPVQTLLNFHTKPASLRATSAATQRRRPEIDPRSRLAPLARTPHPTGLRPATFSRTGRRCHAFSTKPSSTRFSPALSKATVSLLPSMAVTWP